MGIQTDIEDALVALPGVFQVDGHDWRLVNSREPGIVRTVEVSMRITGEERTSFGSYRDYTGEIGLEAYGPTAEALPALDHLRELYLAAWPLPLALPTGELRMTWERWNVERGQPDEGLVLDVAEFEAGFKADAGS